MRAGQVMAATRLGFFVAAGLVGSGAVLRVDFSAWPLRLLVVVAALLALATVALSHRVVTGEGIGWWRYLFSLVPLVQFFVLLGVFREIRDASSSARTKARVDHAVSLILIATLGTCFRWDAELVMAGQALVVVGAWVYVVAVLPGGGRRVGGDGDVEWVGWAGAG